MIRSEDNKELSLELLEFIKNSPTAYNCVEQIKGMVDKSRGCRCVVRNNSSLIAWKMPKMPAKGLRIISAHTDSPMFKIKENPEVKDSNGYVKINVEKYGGMIPGSWMDRPLSVAGRVVYEWEDNLVAVNVDFKKPMYIIPNVAVHMTRGNDDKPLSVQTDMQPIGSAGLMDAVAAKVAEITGNNIETDNILGSDLYVYNCQEPVMIGEDYICAPRIDDLQCVYSAVKAFTMSESLDYIDVLAVFDNEEVGSLSRQGASSDMLKEVLAGIREELNLTTVQWGEFMENSFMISADNSHGVHPNHPEKADPTNKPKINEGIVIKYHGGQKYTTDAYTGAWVKKICRDNNIPYQTYHNNSDIAGGSTLGNLVMSNVSIKAADIGAPQLAMHSAYETAGVKDTAYLLDFMNAFYNNSKKF